MVQIKIIKLSNSFLEASISWILSKFTNNSFTSSTKTDIEKHLFHYSINTTQVGEKMSSGTLDVIYVTVDSQSIIFTSFRLIDEV